MTRLSLLFVVLLCLAQYGCTGVFFIPKERLVRTPTDIGLEYREVKFDSNDGIPLYGWFLPARGKALGSILFLHGNAENISTHIGSVYWLPAKGYNVFLFDYRGYGSSGGSPDVDGVILDAEAAISRLVAMPESDTGPVIVYGQSIGAAIAVYAVAHSTHRDRIDALIAESAFTGYRDIAREKLASFWLTWLFQYPLSWTVTDHYAPIDAVAKVAPIPLLLVYSEEDTVVSIRNGDQLYSAAREPKQFWRMPQGSHIGIFTQPDNAQRLLEYLMSIRRRKD
ncbi:MAG: alpha/beta hydrolase [Gammaproteobacteria bacterium]|nr:alpha/beta hydrolase [Gammaproteobacteria bacterium]